jgi:hypothetical protein
MTSLFLTSSATQLTLDWSHLFETTEEQTHTNIPSLLSWLAASPLRDQVRVVVGSPRRTVAERQLRNALQALGCTVTNRANVG